MQLLHKKVKRTQTQCFNVLSQNWTKKTKPNKKIITKKFKEVYHSVFNFPQKRGGILELSFKKLVSQRWEKSCGIRAIS